MVSLWQKTVVAISLLGRLFDKADLIKPVSNVRLYIRPYARPFKKSFFNFNEIWHVHRGR